ncbi:hypothetical protein LR48_Vigan08g064200 [Vigna angularis]|uniref:Uncharacterized protein n=1 Tax=Phaseolus angularis TaxID=3914 RepID=A0A0L9V422_PHAAN|nr:hypothetical protein LR48_Vigan08g064200 [Vigna angularis]
MGSGGALRIGWSRSRAPLLRNSLGVLLPSSHFITCTQHPKSKSLPHIYSLHHSSTHFIPQPRRRHRTPRLAAASARMAALDPASCRAKPWLLYLPPSLLRCCHRHPSGTLHRLKLFQKNFEREKVFDDVDVYKGYRSSVGAMLEMKVMILAEGVAEMGSRSRWMLLGDRLRGESVDHPLINLSTIAALPYLVH